MTPPIVSVIVPFHNAADYLADALQSVREQTLDSLECLMINDASTDLSRSIAERFVEADSRFQLVNGSDRRGVSASRNLAFERAKGHWFALLDADDLYLPARLERLIRIGEKERADLIFDDQIVTEFPKATSSERAFGFTREQHVFTQEDFFSGSRLFQRAFPVGYMKPIIRREFLDAAGAAYDPSVASGEDFLFYAHLFSARPRCIAVKYAGYVYRRRRGSLSRSDELLHVQVDLGERVLNDLGPTLSAQSRAALAVRRGNFEDVASALPALTAFRDRRWAPLAAMLIRQPGVAVTCLRLFRTKLIRKLSAILP